MDLFRGIQELDIDVFAKKASRLAEQGYALHTFTVSMGNAYGIFVLMPEQPKPKPMGAR